MCWETFDLGNNNCFGNHSIGKSGKINDVLVWLVIDNVKSTRNI